MKDIKELIPEADAFKALTLKDLPALKGTEKQVEWAKKIRHEIILQLFNEATSKDANGRPNALCKIGIRGKDFVQADIEAYASQFDDELVNEKLSLAFVILPEKSHFSKNALTLISQGLKTLIFDPIFSFFVQYFLPSSLCASSSVSTSANSWFSPGE